MDYLMEQYQAAEQTKTFLLKWGLKKSHMAKACNLSADVFSKFLNTGWRWDVGSSQRSRDT